MISCMVPMRYLGTLLIFLLLRSPSHWAPGWGGSPHRVPDILKGDPLGEAETHQEQVGVRVDKAAKKHRITDYF